MICIAFNLVLRFIQSHHIIQPGRWHYLETVLHGSSFHPAPLKNLIPYSQYLRLRRNCSDDILFKEEAKKLQMRLLDRGYSRSCLPKAYNRAIQQTCHQLLFNKQKPKIDQSPGPTGIIVCFFERTCTNREYFEQTLVHTNWWPQSQAICEPHSIDHLQKG